MKHLKTYKLFETTQEEAMSIYYGANVISECDSVIEDIKDMLLELEDIGLHVRVGYTPMTLLYREQSPKISVVAQGDSSIFDANIEDIDSAFERIKDYTKSKGYASGFGSNNDRNELDKIVKIYQMLIQK